MKRMRIVLLMLLCSVAGLGPAEAAPREPLKVVLWLGGFAHEFRNVGGILSEALPRQRPMKINIAWDGDFLDAPQRPDVILMYHCHRSAKDILTEAQKDKLLKVVKEGVGVVALHASYYSFLKWDEYHKFYGARFIKHGKSEARLRVMPIQKQHPIFKGLAGPMEVVSELYQSTPVAKDCDVLAHSQEIGQGKKPQPSIWTRTYGKGRIVTILPGHFADNFREAPFQRLILNSMDWATQDKAGKATADSKAVPVKRNHDWEKAALDAFKLPESFEISLVAAEPHLANPISMTLDEQGRIYVSNAHSYRQKWWLMKPPPAMEPSNPVVCLTLGPDGRAVEATTVAEGFADPIMGLSIRRNRLWVSNRDRLFVTSLGEKGRMAGDRKVLIRDAATAWNPFAMYRVVRGPDDLIYMTVGDHDTRLTGPDGQAAVRLDHKGSGGVFRFREDGSQLELLMEGMRAPFTLGFTPFGRLWVITNGEGSPNCLLDAVRGTDYRFRNGSRGEWFWLTGAEKLAAPAWETAPGAHTAVLPYYSSNLPEAYWGNLFVSNFGVHGSPAKHNNILRFILDDRGRVIRREPFLSSRDSKFRPTQVTLAPDGSLYILDWYGKDDENDLTGRLYQVRYVGKKPEAKAGRGLGSRNHTERRNAGNALLAAGSESALPVLVKTLSGENPLAAAEAIWTLRRSGWPTAADHIGRALSHSDWRVRRHAVQQLREMGKQDKDRLRTLLDDPDPAVQLEVALAFPIADRCDAVVQALQNGAATIRRLRFAGALEIARFGEAVHFAALLGADSPELRLAGLIALDEAFYENSKGFEAPERTARQVLSQFMAWPGKLDEADLLELARRWPHASLKDSVRESVMAAFKNKDISAVDFAQGFEALKRMELPTNSPEIDTAVLRLLRAARTKKSMPSAEKQALLKVMRTGKGGAEKLALLKAFIADTDPAVRAEAGEQLAADYQGDPEGTALCRELALDAQRPLEQRLDAIANLVKLEETVNEDCWTELLRAPERAIVIASLRSLQQTADRSGAQRVIDSTGLQNKDTAIKDDLLFTSAVLAGNALAAEKDKDKLRSRVLMRVPEGNAALGRIVYRAHACYGCHAGKIPGMRAPQLRHIAASHDTPYLIDSVLFPDKAVKTGFLTQMITIRKGKKESVVMGTLQRNISGEARYDQVTDNQGKRALYRKGQVISAKTISTMPAGLEGTMSEPELVDLLSYLKSLK